MRFQSKTEQEIAAEKLLPDGTYDFEVTAAEEKQSKKGNDMIELNLKVYRADGGFIFVRDWIMEAMAMKLIHFCREVGLEKSYEAGELDAQMCVGRSGKLQITQRQQDGFDPQNTIKDYGPGKGVTADKKVMKGITTDELESSEDIPF